MATQMKISSDSFAAHVPKLLADGSNWIYFKIRFTWYADERELAEHLEPSALAPPAPVDASGQPSTDATLLEEHRKSLKRWQSGEAKLKQGFAEVLPNEIFLKIMSKTSAREIWATVCGEFERKTRTVILDLRRQLQSEKYKDGTDIRAHFAKITSIRESLAAMGVTLTEDDLSAVITTSLPVSFDPFISSLTAAEDVTGVALTPEALIQSIVREADRRSVRSSKGKRDDRDVALSVERKWEERTCFNCGKKGHIKRNCFAKGGGKEGQGPHQRKDGNRYPASKYKKPESKNNASAAEEPEEFGAWMVICDDEIPDRDPDRSIDVLGNEADRLSCDDVSDQAINHFCTISDRASDSDVESDWETVSLALASHNRNSDASDRQELYDSGASRHMTPFRHKMINYTSIEPTSIKAANSRTFQAVGKGDMYVNVPCNGKSTRILLKDVLHAPSMSYTLISVSKITASGCAVVFRGHTCKIYNKANKLIGEIPKENGLYGTRVNLEHAATTIEQISVDDLHRRMGHISMQAARDLVEKNLVSGIKLKVNGISRPCDSCEYAKTTRKPIRRERELPLPQKIGDEVSTDLWGPASVKSLSGRRYYESFIDGCTRWSEVYFLGAKDEAFDAYLIYEAELETQDDSRIKLLVSDRGGEYMSREFKAHLDAKGTRRRLTPHDTPEYNGIAERYNRIILDRVRAMIHASGLPRFLWAEAVRHANWLRNRTGTRALAGKTPFEAKYGRKPNLSNLHEWGTKVWVHDKSGSKLSARGLVGRWVGFEQESNAHRIYWPDKRSITVERNVRFDDSEVSVTPKTICEEEIDEVSEGEGSGDSGETTHGRPSDYEPRAHQDSPQGAQDGGTDDDPAEVTLRRSGRAVKDSSYVKRLKEGEGTARTTRRTPVIPRGIPRSSTQGEQQERTDETSAVEYGLAVETADEYGPDPTIEEAKSSPEWPRWREAIQLELDSLKANETWDLVERPMGTNVVSSKWVLRVKRDEEGMPVEYKARLVARGFSQVHGVDYYETFAPVVRLSSLRVVLALAAEKDWEISAFDFQSAYLNSFLDEEVFMEQPPNGFEDADRSRYVLRLNKAIYGLKQAGRRWYESLRDVLVEIGFKASNGDQAVFIWHTPSDITIIAAHVDDCTITGSNPGAMKKVKENLNKRYKLTDLGPLTWLLGISIKRDRKARTISLSQEGYIDIILSRCNFTNMSPRASPMDANVNLSIDQCPKTETDRDQMSNVPYRKCLGMLMWANVATRPEISFAVSRLAQFSENPGPEHWEAVKRVFRYLKGTKNFVLTYGLSQNILLGYSDADGNSQEHRKAISGYAFIINGGVVSWRSRKQEIVTLSTAEAEYVALTHAAKEALWLRRFIHELTGSIITPTMLLCDNQSAIFLTKNENYNARTKHIDIRYHFIRSTIQDGQIELQHCPTTEMVADIFTKPLPASKFMDLAHSLGLHACPI